MFLVGPGESARPAWDRFAHWPAARARVLLLAVIAMLVASALVPLTVGRGEVASVPSMFHTPAKAKQRPRDDDLKLYDAAIARIRKGENYYDFIAGEQRRAHYPLRPGLAVRLPTLAYLDAWLGLPGQILAALLLLGGVLWAWWRRLGAEPGGAQHRVLAMALLFSNAALGLNRYFFVLHELWAGMLIALSLGLHRPREPGERGEGRWFAGWSGAWLAAALALAIRELALPYVLLMAAMAFWRGARREGMAWVALIVVFGIGLAVHLHLIAERTLPGDPVGPSWLALRGLGGWLANMVLSSNLRFLPHWLAGPALMLMLLGFAGWRSAAGATATMLFFGYGVAFMIAGRNDNFYWGVLIVPAMFMGLAFAPMAMRSLLHSALGKKRAKAVA